MANEQNLMPIEQVNSRRTREKHSEDSRKGGKKSGEVRRKRKAMKEQMDLLLSLPFNLKDSKGNAVVDTLEFFGIDKEEIDNQMAMNIALWQTAINSNNKQQIQAIREIRDITKDNKGNQTDLNSVKEVLVKIREVAKNDTNTD
ncbi:MAG: hypothetical protein J6K45_06465 [Clostridia bacterium]|nr:hypothetical protein [Clostridia bacterium]